LFISAFCLNKLVFEIKIKFDKIFTKWYFINERAAYSSLPLEYCNIGRCKMANKARFFGRLRDENDFISLFECSCGNREWIKETQENSKEISCSKCELEYHIIKQESGRYTIAEDENKKTISAVET